MIIDSFSFDGERETVWLNVFIEPLEIDEKTMYIVDIANAGEGIPSPQKLREIALTAETIAPSEEPLSLELLCAYIQDSVNSGTWATPFLISEQLLDIGAPMSAFEEGLSDAARGLHYNANPHVEGTKEADEWDEGWSVGRNGDFDGLTH